MTPRLLPLAALALSVCACATHTSAGREVSAVVQDEGARQAAVVAAQRSGDSTSALEAGAAAAERTRDPSEPPT